MLNPAGGVIQVGDMGKVLYYELKKINFNDG